MTLREYHTGMHNLLLIRDAGRFLDQNMLELHKVHIDVIALDEYLLSLYPGDYDEEEESMKEFVDRKFGPEAVAFVESGICRIL